MSGSGTVEDTVREDARDSREGSRRPGPVARILLAAVRAYRTWISPVLPPSCRFEPSCSAYAVEAVTEHGALRGFWLTLRRLLRCGPWHPGGWDPVPPRRTRDRPEPEATDPAQPTAAEE